MMFVETYEELQSVNSLVKAEENLREVKITENKEEILKSNPSETSVMSGPEELHKRKTDPNYVTLKEPTTLIEVVERGLLASVKFLLDAGEDVNQSSAEGRTPLSYAATAGNLPMMDLLLQYNPVLGRVDEKGNSPLDYVIIHGHSSLAKKLLAPNFFLTQCHLMEAAHHALYVAAKHGNVEMIEHLIDFPEDYECDVNEMDKKSGHTALSSSASQGHSEACAALLKGGAKVDKKNRKGWTPLHCAAKKGDRRTLLKLLQFGARLEEKTRLGKTPLLISATAGNMSAMRTLLLKGANIDECDKQGLDVLTLTALKGHTFCFRYLISQQKLDVNSRNRRELRPIDHAAKRGTVEVVDHLIKAGAHFNRMNKKGMRPLDYAIQISNIAVARHFLNLGCRISLTTWASALKNEECNIMLIKHCLKLGCKMANKKKYESALESFKTGSRHLTKLCENRFEIEDELSDLQASLHLEMSKCACVIGDLKLAEEASRMAVSLRPYWEKVIKNREFVVSQQHLQEIKTWGEQVIDIGFDDELLSGLI